MTIKKNSVFITCFWSLLLLAGCEEEKPKDILSKETMTQLLLEIYVGEGKISSLSIKRDSSLAVFQEYEKLIFQKYEIDRDQYKKSLSYYYDHPIELEEIYDGVLDSLNLKEQKLNEKKEAEKEKLNEESEKEEPLQEEGE